MNLEEEMMKEIDFQTLLLSLYVSITHFYSRKWIRENGIENPAGTIMNETDSTKVKEKGAVQDIKKYMNNL